MKISIEVKHEGDKGKVLVETFKPNDVRLESFIIRPGRAKVISVEYGQYFKVKERE